RREDSDREFGDWPLVVLFCTIVVLYGNAVKTTSKIGTIVLAMTLFAIFLSPASAFPQDGNCTKKDDSSRPDCPSAIAFFNRVQNALRRDDRMALSSMLSYPLRTTLKGRKVYIRDRDQFL